MTVQDGDELSATDRGRSSAIRGFLTDDPQSMTLGRRIALYMMKRYKWYNPRLGEATEDETTRDVRVEHEKPSIEKAWSYFEHVTLQRYVDDRTDRALGDDNDDNKTILQRGIELLTKKPSLHRPAVPNEEEPTKLYSPFTTPLDQMADFGIGFGLYFFTLRAIAILSFILGIINIPNMIYFASSEYSGDKELSGFLQASAICTDQSWVPCPNCKEDQFSTFPPSPINRTIFGAIDYDIIPQEDGDLLNITDFLVDIENDTLFFDEDLLFETFGDVDVFPLIDCSSDLQGGCFVPVADFNMTGDSTGSDVQGGFALRNNCNGATLQQGFVSYASLIVAILGALVIYFMNNRIEVMFDLDEQTAQDYSIKVKNPPADAYDPEEWKAFFEEKFGAPVTVCTVAVDNDPLVKALVERREAIRKLEFAAPPGHSIELPDLEALAKRVTEERFLFDRLKARLLSPDIPEFLDQVHKASEKAKKLMATNTPVSAVFVTFETEKAQRDVLSRLSSKARAFTFRGSRVLKVVEPEEPSTIRWQDLGTTELAVLKQVTLSTISSVIAIALACVLIGLSYNLSPPLGSITTTLATSIYPASALFFTKRESHPSETETQKWLFIKIALFNVVTTVVYLQVATPFTHTLDAQMESVAGLITSVHNLFFSQLLLTPGLQLLDISGHLNRHVLAPRAKTQAAMNNYMKGAVVDLAVRYANMTKFVFLVLCYCAIYPGAFFMASFALFIAYYVDKFCLMRSWGRTPHVGVGVSHFARDFVLPLGIIAMAVISAFTWSGFGYDNLCVDTDPFDGSVYEGEWELEIPGKELSLAGYTIFSTPDIIEAFNITENEDAYRFCNQDLRTTMGASFIPIPDFQKAAWMTDEQVRVSVVYGWTAVVVVALALLAILWKLSTRVLGFFTSTYTPRGRDMKINYSDVATIHAYIPQVESPLYEYPLVITNTTTIGADLFNWIDPHHPHSDYDITKDIEQIVDNNAQSNSNLFAKVAHWCPTQAPPGVNVGADNREKVPEIVVESSTQETQPQETPLSGEGGGQSDSGFCEEQVVI